MNLDIEHAHARVLKDRLAPLETLFIGFVDNPDADAFDKEASAEMLLWVRESRYTLDGLLQTKAGEDVDDDHPLVASMYLIDEQIEVIVAKLREIGVLPAVQSRHP
ncbi:hypothetical protein JKG47_07520 [Acidithiobacillus sp. MC6.1]|nr:hypothetical protein [Acidithiobacillus sp. MC6.1]